MYCRRRCLQREHAKRLVGCWDRSTTFLLSHVFVAPLLVVILMIAVADMTVAAPAIPNSNAGLVIGIDSCCVFLLVTWVGWILSARRACMTCQHPHHSTAPSAGTQCGIVDSLENVRARHHLDADCACGHKLLAHNAADLRSSSGTHKPRPSTDQDNGASERVALLDAARPVAAGRPCTQLVSEKYNVAEKYTVSEPVQVGTREVHYLAQRVTGHREETYQESGVVSTRKETVEVEEPVTYEVLEPVTEVVWESVQEPYTDYETRYSVRYETQYYPVVATVRVPVEERVPVTRTRSRMVSKTVTALKRVLKHGTHKVRREREVPVMGLVTKTRSVPIYEQVPATRLDPVMEDRRVEKERTVLRTRMVPCKCKGYSATPCACSECTCLTCEYLRAGEWSCSFCNSAASRARCVTVMIALVGTGCVVIMPRILWW